VDALGLTRGLDSELNVLHWILVTGQPRRLTAAQATEQCAEVLNAFWSTCLASLSKYKFAVLTVPVGNLDVTDHRPHKEAKQRLVLIARGHCTIAVFEILEPAVAECVDGSLTAAYVDGLMLCPPHHLVEELVGLATGPGGDGIELSWVELDLRRRGHQCYRDRRACALDLAYGNYPEMRLGRSGGIQFHAPARA
jgi:hypothetical protein